MAKERNLPSKATLTTSDFIRVVGSDNASYKQLLSDVMATTGMGETIATSGAWNATTAQTAFKDAYASWGNNTVHVGLLKGGSVASFIAYRADANYGAVQFMAYGNSTNVFVYTMVLYGGTWGALLQTPTRAEVDALSTKHTATINTGASIGGTCTYIQAGKIVVVTGSVTVPSGTAASTVLVSDLPTAVSGNMGVRATNNNAANSYYDMILTSGGGLRLGAAPTANVDLRFTFSYIAY